MTRTLLQTRQEIYTGLIRHFGKTKEGDYLPTPQAFSLVEKMFPSIMLDTEINDAQDYICRLGHCLYFEAYAIITTITDYWFYLWDRCYELKNVYWQEASGIVFTKLTLRSQEDLDVLEPGWEADTVGGTPDKYCHFKYQLGHGSGHSLKLCIKPNNLGTIKITGTRLANTVTANNDLIALEGVWYQSLVDYVLARLTGNQDFLNKLYLHIETMRTEAEQRNLEERIVAKDLEGYSLWEGI